MNDFQARQQYINKFKIRQYLKAKYWVLIVLFALAVIVSLFYYIRQPAEDNNPITISHHK